MSLTKTRATTSPSPSVFHAEEKSIATVQWTLFWKKPEKRVSLFLPETTVYPAPQISQDFFFSKVSQNKKMDLPPSGEVDSKPKDSEFSDMAWGTATWQGYLLRYLLRTVHIHSPDHLTILLRFGSMSQRTFHHSGGKIALYFHGNLKEKACC